MNVHDQIIIVMTRPRNVKGAQWHDATFPPGRRHACCSLPTHPTTRSLRMNEHTRRAFLGAGAAAAALSLAAAPPLPKALPSPAKEAPQPPERRVGWAIVGLGDFALNHLIPAFGACKESKLVALVS